MTTTLTTDHKPNSISHLRRADRVAIDATFQRLQDAKQSRDAADSEHSAYWSRIRDEEIACANAGYSARRTLYSKSESALAYNAAVENAESEYKAAVKRMYLREGMSLDYVDGAVEAHWNRVEGRV